jgi:hypothetical protein
MNEGKVTEAQVLLAQEGGRVIISLPSRGEAILWSTEGQVRLTVTRKSSTLRSEVTQGNGTPSQVS